MEKGFYKKEGIPAEEIERLKKIDYPSRVSVELIGDMNLKGRKFLDVGAGSNSSLGEFVENSGGKYIALDLRMEMLKNIENQFKQDHLNFYGIQASAKDLPITDESVDFVHQRFVLMHLSPEDQKRDIKEVLRVAKDKVFLLEYDWETLSSRENEDILKEFRDLSFQLMGKFKIDPFMGAKLEMLLGEVGQGLDTDIKKFSREESDYTDELIDLCVISNKMATSILKDEDLASKFSALRDKLSNSHIKFTPPSIVAVTVRK